MTAEGLAHETYSYLKGVEFGLLIYEATKDSAPKLNAAQRALIESAIEAGKGYPAIGGAMLQKYEELKGAHAS